jgi:hypothetical protein
VFELDGRCFFNRRFWRMDADERRFGSGFIVGLLTEIKFLLQCAIADCCLVIEYK